MTCRPGLVWATKILTDPFNDFIYLQERTRFTLLRGELIDPNHGQESTDEEEARESYA